MNFFEAQDWYKNKYPGKKIDFSFDANCHRTIETVYTNGLPNLTHHIECNKVCVTVDGMDSVYIPIMPHRMNVSWSDAKAFVGAMNDVYISDSDLQAFVDVQGKSEYDTCMAEWVKASGVSQAQIEAKIKYYQTKKI